MVSAYDFSGYATKNDLKCSDGRTILKNAFKDDDGHKVPLVWNHQHNNPDNILGHAMLENKGDGVYAYCIFNDTPSGQTAKELVEHGDVSALSIAANKLIQKGTDVMHGRIREVSLVLTGANPGALIDNVITHSDTDEGDTAIIYTGESFEVYHTDTSNDNAQKDASQSDKNPKKTDTTPADTNSDQTIQDVIDTMTEEQQTAMYAMVSMALEDNMSHSDDEGGNDEMKQNIFDKDTHQNTYELTHSDGVNIVTMAKNATVGTLRNALLSNETYTGALEHGIDNIDYLFPDHANLKPGAPEIVDIDQRWVKVLMNKVHKSPMSRIRTRQMDISQLNGGKGYTKGNEKTEMDNTLLLRRTTDPTTVYEKESLHRDDILDITDFDVVRYQQDVMKIKLHESVATAIMIGDGRPVNHDDKIDETKIRPIWTDEELYTIHKEIDIEATEIELQGNDTAKNFGKDYIFTEAVITASLYAREEYKGTGNLDFYCTTHTVNRMMLSRDMNGRRVYATRSELASALNVENIYEVEQFANKKRTTTDGSMKSLLGIFVNMADYNVGSVRGGEITTFNQFDIDFNKEKMLIETRLSGALTRVKSAIVLEEPVNALG